MKRYLIFVGLLVLVAGLAISVALVTQDVGAYSNGWGDGSNCDTCHDTTGILGSGTGVHAVSSHSGFACGDCHDGAPSAGTVSPGTCADCHVDGTSLALADVHESDHDVTVCRSCHAAATTTTTSESTTTTTSESTTTTTGATTTTTEGVTTSTTEGDSTTTTEAETTTTTVPTGEPDFTG